jgi:hypothetical protein
MIPKRANITLFLQVYCAFLVGNIVNYVNESLSYFSIFKEVK